MTENGFYIREDRTVISVKGKDRATYLHRMISNEVKALAAGKWNYAALLTHKGKIQADMAVYNLGEEIWLEVNRAVAVTTCSMTPELKPCSSRPSGVRRGEKVPATVGTVSHRFGLFDGGSLHDEGPVGTGRTHQTSPQLLRSP